LNPTESNILDFFTTIEKRRSIRRFTEKPVPADVIEKALYAATMAPNSSNTQTWDFYWVRSPEPKAKLVQACLSQAAARNAQELVVVVASPKTWKRSQPVLTKWVKSINAPKSVILYYEKLIPGMYRWGFLNSFGIVKKVILNLIGIFRPIVRGPSTRSEIQEVAIKSAALAAENFVLAISAQGFSSCMMEGFDECRVSKLLKLRCSDRVVMVISVGEEATDGTWGPRFRLPIEQVVHQI
jgi:nitroreductase